MQRQVLRGAYYTYKANPFIVNEKKAVEYISDALIIIENGLIIEAGPYEHVKSQLKESDNITQYGKNYIILPGFIDSHVHYPQIQMTGAYGKHLVDWLNKYVFVAEQDFSNKEHARALSQLFLRECIRAGTTTAFVYATVYPDSVDAFFEESEKLNMRMATGKVLMDRNAPKALRDTPKKAYDDSKALLEKWHNRQRQMYCITPRFAPTSTAEQLELAGALWREFPDVYMQTHLAETLHEIDWVKSLFPKRKGYLDVYQHYGLTGPKAIFGHCIHLSQSEMKTLYESQSTISHCPTSNLFLGSGLFNIAHAYLDGDPFRVSLGSDLGAGTNFSALVTLNEAYKVALLNNCTLLDSPHAMYLLTRGGAHALMLDNRIGTIAKGYEADLVVLDMHATPYLDARMHYVNDINEALFLQMTCGDDRSIHATYIAGECLYQNNEQSPGHFLGSADRFNQLNSKE